MHEWTPGTNQEAPSPLQRENRPVPYAYEANRSMHRLYWFVAFLTVLFTLQLFVPRFVEQVQYSMTRGRQRAEVEIAEKALDNLPLENLSLAYQLISKRVAPSVVHIDVVSLGEAPTDEFSVLFGPGVQRGEGSGVIVDQEGYVITNNHVVRGARQIRVDLSDGRSVPAEVVGTDPATDLALLKLDADGVIAAEWGQSDDLEVGALVWAVGSPFGLQQTVTFGILSAKQREGLSNSPYLDFLQTDAAVNPGNSGGPLVDTQGRVVGINTAIIGEFYQGISFAIPSSVARRVYEQLRSGGHVLRGWLGVQLADVDAALAAEFDLGVERGALVTHLSSASGLPSPAEEAGIRPGDVILRWDDHQIDNSLTLQRRVALTPPGSVAEVTVLRRGREVTFQVTLGERPRTL